MELLDCGRGSDEHKQLNEGRVGELFDLLEPGDTLWRCDVAFESDSPNPAFVAWKQKDVESTVELLLGGIGWVEQKDEAGVEVDEECKAFIEQEQVFAGQGGELQRVVVVKDPEEAFRLGSGLSFRLQAKIPLLHIPPENVWMLPQEACLEAGFTPLDFDVNWYGPDCMMTTHYDAGGTILERRIFDSQNTADDPDMDLGWEYRQRIDGLIEQGAAKQVGPIEDMLWVSDIAARIRSQME